MCMSWNVVQILMCAFLLWGIILTNSWDFLSSSALQNKHTLCPSSEELSVISAVLDCFNLLLSWFDLSCHQNMLLKVHCCLSYKTLTYSHSISHMNPLLIVWIMKLKWWQQKAAITNNKYQRCDRTPSRPSGFKWLI